MISNVSQSHALYKDKTCIECGVYKQHTDFSFHKHPYAPEGYASMPRCKPCHSAWKNKQHIKRNYGLEWDEYVALLDKQKGKCFLCGSNGSGKDSRLVVDHDHETGEVRGLLCWNCNVGIGLFKEDTELLNKVIKYINREIE
jgi:hypothetical protein